MELRQLRYAVAVADHGTFRAAAEAMFVAQPAISQQVARLERELGLRLFDRDAHHVAITPAGTTFLASARKLLAMADETRELADELGSASRGLLRVGTTGGLGARLPQIMHSIQSDQPQLRVLLEARHTPTKLAMLGSGELDAAFVREPGPAKELQFIPLWQDELAVLLPATSSLAKGTQLELAELGGLRIMLPDRHSSPGVHERITSVFRRAGIALRPAPSRGGLQETLAEVGFGNLAAFVYLASLPMVQAHKPPGVSVRQIAGSPLRIGCELATRRPPSASVRHFINAASRIAASQPRPDPEPA